MRAADSPKPEILASVPRGQASDSHIGISLALDSASSAAGSDPATMPQPANRRICRGSVSLIWPQRSAIAHSPSPPASIQPTGPA